ncbi:Heavy metal transport/detoxification superfamily protein [Perilla frutescens var. frutescens]|nr:Heavy metal transport/detoxification superfamily protein [Perilla frutescens var. frutescens]
MFPVAAYTSTASCLSCIGKNSNFLIHDDEFGEIKTLIPTTQKKSAALKLKDAIAPTPTLAFHLKPKMVVLKVSMHCNGCARKVEKHISKLEGVSSYQIDLETKMVVIRGDIVPFEVLESVSRVKYVELWEP